MEALALALEKGEKIRADKEKQMKEEEAVVEAVLRLFQTIKVEKWASVVVFFIYFFWIWFAEEEKNWCNWALKS